MKNGWTEKQVRDRLKRVMDQLEEARAELDALISDEGEQVRVSVRASGSGYMFLDVTTHKETKYSTLVTGYYLGDKWKDFEPISGDLAGGGEWK